MSSPRKRVLRQLTAHFNNRAVDVNAGKDPLIRNDITTRLDTNVGDVPPPQYFQDCCYPFSGSTTLNPPGSPFLIVSSGSALLVWTLNPANESYFSVEESLTGTGSFNQLTTTTNFNYTDTNVTRSNTYWYRVVGINDAGTGSYSNIANITFPDIPSGPITLNVFSGSAITQWTSSISNAVFWDLQRSTDGITYVNYATTTASIKTYTDTSVTASSLGTTYWYQVAAVNSWGTSSFSNTSSITFTLGGGSPPSAPIFLEVFSGSANLIWQSGSNNDVDFWTIHKSSTGPSGSYSQVGTTSQNTLTLRDHNVTQSITYWYKVAGVNSAGTSSFSNLGSIAILPCSSGDFQPIIYTGYINHSNGSTFRNFYGIQIPITTSFATQSISVWGRSQDFSVHLTLADATGSIIAENNLDGWTPSGDQVTNGGNNAAFTAVIQSGSYNLEISSDDNNIGRYAVYVSPGPKLETTWSTSLEPAYTMFASSSKVIGVGENGVHIVFYNTVNATTRIVTPPGGSNGLAYSPIQDKFYGWNYYGPTNGLYSMSIDIYDNTGSLVQQVIHPRTSAVAGGTSRIRQGGNIVYLDNNSGTITDFTAFTTGSALFAFGSPNFAGTITQVINARTMSTDTTLNPTQSNVSFQITPFAGLMADYSGYLCYDEKNDRIFFHAYNYSTTTNWHVFDCAQRSFITGGLMINPGHLQMWECCYSRVNNCYYVAPAQNGVMNKIDASTFTVTTTSVQSKVICDYISSSNQIMIRKSDGKVSFYDPLNDGLVYTQTDLPEPSYFLFEGGAVGDDCTNVYASIIDSRNGPSISSLALLDKNTFLAQNYLTVNSFVVPGQFFPNGYFGYSLCYNPNDSRIYVSEQSSDNNSSRLLSIRLSRAGQPPVLNPYTTSFVDTASCLVYSGSFHITGTFNTSALSQRPYPSFVCMGKNATSLNTLMVSDNELVTNDFKYHNRTSWFFKSDGTPLNKYTSSYIHTWNGSRNAVWCDHKFFSLSDELLTSTNAGQTPMTASHLVVFDVTGSFLSAIPLTHPGLDWDTDDNSVWVYETDGTNLYLEQFTGSDGSSQQVSSIYTDFTFTNTATLSPTSSTDNSVLYYHGKIFAIWNSGNPQAYVNGFNSVNRRDSGSVFQNGLQTSSADVLITVVGGSGAYYGMTLDMTDNIGISTFGGWAGSLVYCPINARCYVGAWSSSLLNYPPVLIETDSNLNITRQYNLTQYTASNFLSVDAMTWNPKNRTIEILSTHNGANATMLVFDPVAGTIICRKDVWLDVPTGSSFVGSITSDNQTGKVYIPQRFDGDFTSMSGSIKVYRPSGSVNIVNGSFPDTHGDVIATDPTFPAGN